MNHSFAAHLLYATERSGAAPDDPYARGSHNATDYSSMSFSMMARCSVALIGHSSPHRMQ